ncbi:MAG: helix-turn-helix transcriptional regulator, partial [Paenibacillaceae bacterium]|nr:helix-turn-helix transcriptional regulator [Paenibacillaceae bacterium]
IDLRNGSVALIVGAVDAAAEQELVMSLREIQRTIAHYYGVTLSVAVSEPVGSVRDVSDGCRLAVQMLANRMIYGAAAIITPAMVAEVALKRQEFAFPPDFDKKLMLAIHTQETSAFERLIDQLFADMSGYHADYIGSAVLQLMIAIKRVLREAEPYTMQNHHRELQQLNEQVVGAETLAEAADSIKRFFNRYVQQQREAKENKNQALVDTIKEMIEKNYMDLNVSLQSIATLLKMSTAYVGRIFKQSESMSVAEYINHIRLEYAKHYIEASGCSIKDIVDKTGFSSLSYFSTLFKKKYGIAPKDYQTKFALRNTLMAGRQDGGATGEEGRKK